MAVIAIERDEIVVSMSRFERLMALRGDLRLPLGAVRSAGVVEDPWRALRGIRAPGTGLPGVVAYGVRRMTGDRPDFTAVHGRGPAVRVRLDTPSEYAEVMVTVHEPERIASQVAAAAGRAAGQ